MLSSLILDSNKKVTHWLLTEVSFKIIKPFGTNLELTMSNLANNSVIISVLLQKSSSLLHRSFASNL